MTSPLLVLFLILLLRLLRFFVPAVPPPTPSPSPPPPPPAFLISLYPSLLFLLPPPFFPYLPPRYILFLLPSSRSPSLSRFLLLKLFLLPLPSFPPSNPPSLAPSSLLLPPFFFPSLAPSFPVAATGECGNFVPRLVVPTATGTSPPPPPTHLPPPLPALLLPSSSSSSSAFPLPPCHAAPRIITSSLFVPGCLPSSILHSLYLVSSCLSVSACLSLSISLSLPRCVPLYLSLCSLSSPQPWWILFRLLSCAYMLHCLCSLPATFLLMSQSQLTYLSFSLFLCLPSSTVFLPPSVFLPDCLTDPLPSAFLSSISLPLDLLVALPISFYLSKFFCLPSPMSPSIPLSVRLFFYLLLYLSVCSSVCSSFCLSVFLPIYLSLCFCVSLCLTLPLSAYLPISPYVCLSASLSMSLCLSAYS